MKALLLIDLQVDFMPGGSLPVTDGDAVVPYVNDIIGSDAYEVVVATADWHPVGHMSFASSYTDKHPFEVININGLAQTLWPDHCVQGTKGATLHPELNTNFISAIFRKGVSKDVDSYSAFFENDKKKRIGLDGFLREKGINEISICGLAGDVCVAYSINDALELGYKIELLTKGVRAINATDYNKLLSNWRDKGVKIH